MGMHAHAHTTCCGWRRQVSLAWILVHLYEEPELLAAARHELEGCSDLANYSQLQQMEVQDARLSYARGHYRRLSRACARACSQFVNSCIDESVRLHTMLPGNTVLRKTLSDVRLLDVDIPADSLLWLYPNAVHQDEQCARLFAPLRFAHTPPSCRSSHGLYPSSLRAIRRFRGRAELLPDAANRGREDQTHGGGVRAGHLRLGAEAVHRREDGPRDDLRFLGRIAALHGRQRP